jgi:hypothetical protein
MTTFNYLNEITTEDQAYCLGFFAYIYDSDSFYLNNYYEIKCIYIYNNVKLFNIFKKICYFIINKNNDNSYDDKITFKIKYNVINDILNNIKNFDNFNDNLKIAFIKGLYEYNSITFFSNLKNIYFKQPNYLKDVFIKIFKFLEIPYSIDETDMETIKLITIKSGIYTIYLNKLFYDNNKNSLLIIK